MKRISVILWLCLMCPLTCAAAEMDRVVHNLELDLGVRHTHIPLLGVAMFMGKVATGFQMPGAKIAVFSDERLSGVSPAEIQQSISKALGPKWAPFVKSTSKCGDEQNWIYMAEEGKKLQIFITSLDAGELSLVEVKVSEKQIRRWMDEPQKMAKRH